MPAPLDVQDAFATAVRSRTVAVPPFIRNAKRGRADRRFAVYRNNVMAGLVAALEARFPVVVRLVGAEFFRAMAHAYVQADPPRSPVLLAYGDTFPAFVGCFAPAAVIPYLADIARLELARGVAYHAADAEPLGRAAFAALAPATLGAIRMRLHPSASIISSRFPIVSIWRAHQDEDIPAPVESQGGESALVARPRLDVEVHRLAPGVDAFLQALAGGMTLAGAVEAGETKTAAFDTAAALALLIASEVVVELEAQ